MESLRVSATLDSLEKISTFVVDATTRAGLDDHAAWQVQLAVDEAATNIIQHGYNPAIPGIIDIAWRVEHDKLIVTLRDRGRRFNPKDVPAPNIQSPLEEREPGGLGLYLMNKLMDDVHFEFDDDDGNLLTMSKQIIHTTTSISIFSLEGRLDAINVEQALAPIREAMQTGARQVLLDMCGVNFLSSSGLRSLLLLRKDMLAHNGELRLCAMQPQVYEVFTLTGFTQIFAIHPTREDALAAFGQGSM